MTNVKPRSIMSPGKYIGGRNVLADINKHVSYLGDSAFVICDSFIFNNISAIFTKISNYANFDLTAFSGECSYQEIDRLTAVAKDKSYDMVIGIGGGKTLDTAKMVAFSLHLPIVICPTIASTDAPCIALSVLYKETGEFERLHYLPKNPDMVLVDLGIIANAPMRFFSAGIGDALATYFEARACHDIDAINQSGYRQCTVAYHVSTICYDVIKKNIDEAMLSIELHIITPAFEEMVDALIYLSGIGAESCGVAMAHAICNGMSVIELLHKRQHGEKVAFGLLVQLILEHGPKEELLTVISLMKKARLPMTFASLGAAEIEPFAWRNVAEKACQENESSHNMPKRFDANEVYEAILAADALGTQYEKQ
ncbi:glycerol dehydrogenase [Martelella alba]|uniref:Glycerol dehydrogenase n=1 Tax=Martelella alba TaxID=2590451 RepID=A0ABY2SLH2_9HYPH|nr:glycerol dehydrogenase [Martelella alba]TKI05991.1 glycerol dehydrogenase [Martelella alba]